MLGTPVVNVLEVSEVLSGWLVVTVESVVDTPGVSHMWSAGVGQGPACGQLRISDVAWAARDIVGAQASLY